MALGLQTRRGNANNPGIPPRVPQLRILLPLVAQALEVPTRIPILRIPIQVVTVHHLTPVTNNPVAAARRLQLSATAPLPARQAVGTV